MDIERSIICKAAQAGQFEKLLQEGIEQDHFFDAEVREIFRFGANHVRKYKHEPSLATLKSKYPDFRFRTVTDSTQFLIDKLINQVCKRKTIEVIREIASQIDDTDEDDFRSMGEAFMDGARKINQTVPQSSVGRYSNMSERIKQYEMSKQMGWDTGIKTGIKSFDDEIIGIQSHELVCVVGYQGFGKSTLLQHILYNAYKQGYTPMLVSLEMDKDSLLRRWDAMTTHFNHRSLKKHELTDEQMIKWERASRRVKKKENDIIIIDTLRKGSIDNIYGEIIRHEPDIVAIDYINLMDAPNKINHVMWEKLTYITRELKAIARSTNIPILGAAQTNRESAKDGATLVNIAHSSSVAADSDIVIGMAQTPDQERNKQMVLNMLKNRDGRRVQAKLLWDLPTMTIREWSFSDAFKELKDGEENKETNKTEKS